MDRPRVDPELLRDCSRVSAWKSPLLCVGLVAAAAALAWVGGPGSRWRLAAPAVLVVAGLQHHLLTLLHEAAHLLVHPRRRVNDLLGDVFCAVPFFTLLKRYRLFHLTHHKYAESPGRDPEVLFYRDQGYAYVRRGPAALARLLLADLLLVNLYRSVRRQISYFAEAKARGLMREAPVRDAALYLAVWGGLAAAASLRGFWPELLVFWVLPALTLTPLLVKLHGYGEHTGATGPTEFERTWVHRFHPIENFFLYPIKSGYHLEHHLFPKVPWYHMERFRRGLLADPSYAERAGRLTATSYFFGERSILRSMLLGSGSYRAEAEGAAVEEIAGPVVAPETRGEVDEQLAALAGRTPV
jgi:fatty acid desaturase